MFSEQDRAIFEYHDGNNKVFADPLALRRKLYQVFDGDPDRAIQAAAKADTKYDDKGQEIPEEPAQLLNRMYAEEKLVAGFRQLFDMAPFDRTTGTGASEAMCRQVWAQFVEFLEKNDARGEGSPTGSAATESSPTP